MGHISHLMVHYPRNGQMDDTDPWHWYAKLTKVKNII